SVAFAATVADCVIAAPIWSSVYGVHVAASSILNFRKPQTPLALSPSSLVETKGENVVAPAGG
ncbi:MAG: hypothetical protein ACYDD1_04405, partial [Caulobacteraceae bacterium]